MNFTIKYHKPAQACMCLLGKPTNTWYASPNTYNWATDSTIMPTCSFKDTSGNDHTGLLNGWGTKQSSSTFETSGTALQHNRGIFWNLTAYASSESITDFNEDDYAIGEQVGVASQSFSYGYTNNTYSVSVRNSSESAITVRSIKLTKPLYATSGSTTASTCLMYTCYLDEEVTIPAGSEKVFIVVFNFLNP